MERRWLTLGLNDEVKDRGKTVVDVYDENGVVIGQLKGVTETDIRVRAGDITTWRITLISQAVNASTLR